MIRGTTSESIQSASKLANNDVGRGESYELVNTSAGLAEKRDFAARVAGQTQTPSNRHNGPTE